jgi:hypothetical protein
MALSRGAWVRKSGLSDQICQLASKAQQSHYLHFSKLSTWQKVL